MTAAVVAVVLASALAAPTLGRPGTAGDGAATLRDGTNTTLTPTPPPAGRPRHSPWWMCR